MLEEVIEEDEDLVKPPPLKDPKIKARDLNKELAVEEALKNYRKFRSEYHLVGYQLYLGLARGR